MSILDSINAESGLAGTEYNFIDADTLVDKGGNRFRIQGIDAPEVEKIVGGQYKLGTAGGEAATEGLRGLANQMEFTNVVHLKDEDGNPLLDPFGRQLIDLQNKNGESFKSKILESGVLGTNRYTKATDRLTSELGQLRREQGQLAGEVSDTPWDQARNALEQAVDNENVYKGLFKQTAIDESQLYFMSPEDRATFFNRDNVQIRDYDRTINNQSLNPFSDNWEQGWIGVKEGAYGMLELMGETAGNEWLSDIGEAGIARARTQIQDYGQSLKDWKDIDGFGDAISYVTNNAALSLPYMAISMGGALAAPMTGGLSLTAPASIYAGQTWNDMEGEKNAAIAIGSGIAQAALDRLGIGFIAGKAGKVGGTQLLKEATEELVRGGMTRELAEQTVMQATRKELAGFVGDAAQVARNQITAKETFKKLAGGFALGSGGEGITEGLQESIGYASSTDLFGGSDKVFDFNELTERALAGAIAGAALGGAFSVPGTIYEQGAWADVAVRQAPADARRLSQAGKWAEHERAQHGRVQSIEELNFINRTNAANRGANTIPTLEERADLDKARRRGRTFSETLAETTAAAPSLWRGATRFIFTPDLQNRSRAARVMADMFGGNLQRTFSGSNYESAKHHRVTQYKNMVPIPENFFAAWSGGKRLTNKQRDAASKEAYDMMRQGIDPDGNFNPDLIPDHPKKQIAVQMARQLQALSDKMYQDQTNAGGDLGRLQNYLLRYKSFNKKAILNDKHGFSALLQQEFNMSDADAMEIADAITSSTEINDIAEALDATQAAGRPGSHKQRTLNLAENEAFQQYMNQDIFANVADAAKSAARFTEYQNYVGDNNSILNELLHQMEQEGVPPSEVNKVAKQMQDYLAAESGNYKRPKSDFWKNAQRIQRNFMMVTTIAGLPLATISSFVEAALTMRALTMDQIFGKGDKPGGLFHLGNELGDTLWKGMQEVVDNPRSVHRDPNTEATRGKELIRQLGYYDWDVGAATTTGVTEVNPWQQWIYENFFKWTGLQGWTNYTRSVRAAIAGDFIVDKIEQVMLDDGTNATQEAREQLRNLGINVDDVIRSYRGNGMFDPANADMIADNFKEGIFNFVNEAVALPGAANRPLLYQDPRFALFTQFQGFIATFTANHIPKLWGEYVKRGTPAMKYNAFAVMTTMIMLGFASQYLKDLIKYGQLPHEMGFGPRDHPYLNPSEYIQRGIRASGLLGTGERVLDQFFPLYEQRSDGVGEWAFNGITGESPALGFLKRGGEGVGKVLTGDVGGAAKEAVRFTPAGPVNWIRDKAEGYFDNWNFSGE